MRVRGDGGDSDLEMDNRMEESLAKDIIDYVFFVTKAEAHINDFYKGMLLFCQEIPNVILDVLFDLEKRQDVIRLPGTDIWKARYDYGTHSIITDPDKYYRMEYPGPQPFSKVDYHEECAEEYTLSLLRMQRVKNIIQAQNPSEISLQSHCFDGSFLCNAEIHTVMKDLDYVRCGDVYFKI